jgi:RimJ/RimL family protein N-acetyltransferase
MTTIRPASDADLARVLELEEHFYRLTPYRDRLADNPAQRRAISEWLMTNDEATLLVIERNHLVVGMIGLFLFDHPLSAERLASELFWWVEPEARGIGVRLLRAAERWAADHGALRLQMIAPDPEVARLYERLGYQEVERSYERRLTPRVAEAQSA